jgi:hypothetical protein
LPQPIGAQLESRIAAGATSLCQLLEITLRDGTIIRRTTATRQKTFGGNLFKPGGFDPTNIMSTSETGIGNLSITAYFDQDITEYDVRTGRYTGVTARILWGDYMFPQYGTMVKFNGVILSASITREGACQFNLSGQSALWMRPLGETRMPNCRAIFGDTRCKFPVEDHRRSAVIVAHSGRYLTIDYDGTDPQVPLAHEWWRIVVQDTQYPGSDTTGYNTRLQKVEFRETIGGADIAGGTIIASENLDDADNAFDSSTSLWTAFSQQAKWIGKHWSGAPKAITQVMLKAASEANYARSAPTHTALEWSDNGTTWTRVIGFTENQQTWNPNQERTYQNTFQSATRQLSFQAGLVLFDEGENAGDSYDIINVVSGAGELEIVRLALIPSRLVVDGEAVWVYPGCDKTLARCKFWNNVVNFRGEPHVPTATVQGQQQLPNLQTNTQGNQDIPDWMRDLLT